MTAKELPCNGWNPPEFLLLLAYHFFTFRQGSEGTFGKVYERNVWIL